MKILVIILMFFCATAASAGTLDTIDALEAAPEESDKMLIRDDATDKSITTLYLMRLLEGSLTDFEIHSDNYTGGGAAGHENGANCAAGSYPLGVDGDGIVENCTDATTEIDDAISIAATNNVTAAAAFATDNVLIKSDSTGRGTQYTGIVVSDDDVINPNSAGTDSFYTYPDADAEGVDLDDERSCRTSANLTTTTEDSEDADFWLECVQGGTHTEIFRFDESDDAVEFSKPVTAPSISGGKEFTVLIGADPTIGATVCEHAYRLSGTATSDSVVTLPASGLCAAGSGKLFTFLNTDTDGGWDLDILPATGDQITNHHGNGCVADKKLMLQMDGDSVTLLGMSDSSWYVISANTVNEVTPGIACEP